jgi:Anti-sigma factor NepR
MGIDCVGAPWIIFERHQIFSRKQAERGNSYPPNRRHLAGRAMPEAQGPGKKKTVGNAEDRIARAIRERVGEHLRQMYSEIVKEPIPPRIADLLRRLER